MGKKRVKNKTNNKVNNKATNKINNQLNEKYEKTVRSLVGLGIFPMAYFLAFLPEMTQWKSMTLFAVIMLTGNAALIRNHRSNRYLVPMLIGFFILGAALNITFHGTANMGVLLAVGVVFALKFKTYGEVKREVA
ncbi:hypothetical protein PM10SUCC1_30800 [Propionigenium maris DSM 9537]|uniref:Uncharacterized protein n=1 Tax=Propionigenium maris DSM 9537 TaxID=1123000 RepID=A0A9W6GPF1_9FUSO|nr:hypothetical protein [Propionigenium maris]GLI57566.1 hypothetical protein PM10SUCC1_30800 [Propionigenium maris DSM 9537]